MAFNNENVLYLEAADFDDGGGLLDASIDSTKPVLVMIYGVHCPHCHRVMPDFIRLTKEKGIAIFAAIEVDGDHADAALVNKLGKFIPGLQGVPTFVLFRNGRYIKTHQGARTIDSLRRFIQS